MILAFDFLGVGKFVWKLLIGLVAGVYHVVNYTYQVFLVLSENNIFDASAFEEFSSKIYTILGVMILFVFAYNILTYIIDPDKDKGGTATWKLISKIVTSFVLIVLCPFLFSLAYRIQTVIIKDGVITRFFSVDDSSNFNDTKKTGGMLIAANTYSAFFTKTTEGDLVSKDECEKDGDTCTLEEAVKISIKNENFRAFRAFAENLVDDELDFNWLVALAAGIYLVYMIISFCFDLAVRVCKLALYQIIAPICIACRILPKQESIFTNWWKAVSKTYFSVFIRVIIMNLSVFFISVITKSFDSGEFNSNFCAGGECSFGVNTFAKVIIILGIITFMRQASKLIDEIFGFGDVKLGIRDKIKEGGGFVIGAAVGSGVTAGVRNAYHGAQNFRDAEGAWGKTKAAFRGVGSTIGGLGSGAVRGGRSATNAGTFTAMRDAAGKGASAAVDARDSREARRERYRATGGNVFTRTMAGGHVVDAAADIKDWATGGTDQYTSTIKAADAMTSSFDAIDAQAQKIYDKYKNNMALKVNMGANDFKGDPASVARMYQIYQDYSGQSLSAMETALENLKNVDVAQTLEKSNFMNNGVFDQDAYDTELDRRRREHTQKVADFSSMYAQLKKKSLLNLEEEARNSVANHTSFAGIKWDEMVGIDAAINDFNERFKAGGESVTDPLKGDTFDRAHGNYDPNSVKTLKDVADAYKNVGNDAKRKSADLRLKAEQRKKDSK